MNQTVDNFITKNTAFRDFLSRLPKLIDQMVRGYLDCAVWANSPEEEDWDDCEFAPEAIHEARRTIKGFVAMYLPLVRQALDQPGYSAEQFGHDFWLTCCGHGTGFWDREGLDVEPVCRPPMLDRDGDTYSDEDRDLGYLLSAACYGTHSAISAFAYPDIYLGDDGELYINHQPNFGL